jgi:hypothetical protein
MYIERVQSLMELCLILLFIIIISSPNSYFNNYLINLQNYQRVDNILKIAQLRFEVESYHFIKDF